MKPTIQALVLGMLLAVPAFAQEQAQTTDNKPQAQVTTPAPAPPAKDPNDWKRPLKDIKFREF